jgi:hypothetical protein
LCLFYLVCLCGGGLLLCDGLLRGGLLSGRLPGLRCLLRRLMELLFSLLDLSKGRSNQLSVHQFFSSI